METLDAFQAAPVLGCSPDDARHILCDRRLPLPEVEHLALRTYPWRRFMNDARSYWVTVRQAARILGVSRQRVQQLLEADRLPYEVASGGTRLMRRRQLETVARARMARRFGLESPE
jgi:excisionase family DNA binding protein